MSKNQKLKIGQHNVETGELVYRDMTDEEITQMELDAANAVADKAAAEARAAEKQALLDRLGITADEAKLLLG
jgi:FMN-dependent NADH-azoreductase